MNKVLCNDYLMGIDVNCLVANSNPRVILFDRYDLYKGYAKDLINEQKNKSIILVDCKHNFDITDADEWCDIEMTPGKIEVFE